MHHQLHQVLDACVLGVTTLVTLATTVILNETPQDAAERMEMQLLLLPFIGSLCVSGGLIMLNPNPETRKITLGRGILALFFGVLGPLARLGIDYGEKREILTSDDAAALHAAQDILLPVTSAKQPHDIRP